MTETTMTDSSATTTATARKELGDERRGCDTDSMNINRHSDDNSATSNARITVGHGMDISRCGLRVSDARRDLRREISERGAIEILIGEMEKIASWAEQEDLSREGNERIRAIATELRRAIVDKKASNEKEEERLTRKLASTRV